MKRNKGYVLVYSLIAMMLACALVLSTVTIVLYYGNNINRTIGGNGAKRFIGRRFGRDGP